MSAASAVEQILLGVAVVAVVAAVLFLAGVFADDSVGRVDSSAADVGVQVELGAQRVGP